MEEFYASIIARLNADPGFFSHLGMKVAAVGKGCATVSLTVGPEHLNPRGIVHGGCVYALCDAASGVCALSLGTTTVTSEGSIHYLRPCPGTGTLLAEATVLKGGRRLIINEVTVRGEGGKLLAKATITQCVQPV